MSASPAVETRPFGRLPDGAEATLYLLRNAAGRRCAISDYGGLLVALEMPDRDGRLANLVLGFADVAGYRQPQPYFGATVGRYAGRIGGARFTLDGEEYRLAQNRGGNALHGGVVGFDKAIWQAEPLAGDDGPALRLRHTSPDGDEGYPGTLEVELTYTLTEDDALRLEYAARCDRATVLNLTNHSYFNLAGAGSGHVLDHVLTLHADWYAQTDADQIPTGELLAVAGTALDFSRPHRIGERIDAFAHPPHNGYDHSFVLTKPQPGALTRAATVSESTSGRSMTCATTEPSVQFFTANGLNGSLVGAEGVRLDKHAALCLETQHLPNSPNVAHFPSTVLRPGETYRQTTVYAFSSV